jgi:fatty acid desaturase
MVNAENAFAHATPDLRQTIKDLSRVSTARSLYHAFECWLIIILAVYVSATLLPLSSGIVGVAVYLGAAAVIAARQHALMVLTHEGIHKRLSRSLWVNDWLARLTMAFPVFTSLSKWRFIHLYHHQAPHTADDPDRAIYARYPLERRKFLRVLLRDLSGLNVPATLKYFMDVPFVARAFNRRFLGEDRVTQYRNVSDMRAFWIFWAVGCGGGVLIGGMRFAVILLLYWLIPYCTLTQVFFRIRGAIEHGNVPDPRNPYRQTRTYFLNPILGFFFAPKHVNYHLEHHLYPSIPFYYLPRVHAVLRQWVYPQVHGYCEPFALSLRKLIR